MNEVFPGHRLSHEKRVALYIHIIQGFKLPLSQSHVATMRAKAPGSEELEALNEALRKLGFQG